MKTPLIMAVVIGVLVLIVGCTQQAEVPEAGSAAPQVTVDNSEAAPLLSVQSYQVVIENGKLMPVDVEINTGDTVEWVNKDEVRYTLRFSGSEERLPVGGTFESTFTEPGITRYTAIAVEEREEDEVQDNEDDEQIVLHGTVIIN